MAAVLDAKKVKDWQTGELKGLETQEEYLGTSGGGTGGTHPDGIGGTYNTASTSSRAKYQQVTPLTIESGSTSFVFQFYHRSKNQPVLTVNAPIQFLLKGNEMQMIDERGKEYSRRLREKTAKR